MNAALAIVFIGVALLGAGVAFTRDPLRCAIVYGAFGTMLTLAFFIMQAPDVALSELTVGTVLIPAIVLIAVVKTTRAQR
jgi:uncharacterized MnhB-related membrane protein